MTPKKFLAALSAAVITVTLSACVSLDSPELGADGEAPSVEATDAADDAAAGGSDRVGTFGQPASWEGVDVLITEPAAFEPSEYAAGTDVFDQTVVVEVTVTNTGSEPYDPSMAYITASSGGSEAAMVVDTEKSVEGQPMTPVLPGKSVTWKSAFGVSDPADVLVQFSPGMEAESVLYQTGS